MSEKEKENKKTQKKNQADENKDIKIVTEDNSGVHLEEPTKEQVEQLNTGETVNSLVETADIEQTTPVAIKAPVLDLNDDEQDIVEVLHKTAIVSEVKNDEGIKQKIVDQAHKTINQTIQKIDSDNTVQVQDALYGVNKEACNCYGIENSVPSWEVKLMRAGHAVWFVIYWIFASFTICPVNVFAKGISSFIKNSWLAVIVAILCYAAIAIGLPLLITWLKSKGIDPDSLKEAAQGTTEGLANLMKSWL